MTTTTGTPFIHPEQPLTWIVPVVVQEGQTFETTVNLTALREALNVSLPGRVFNAWKMIDVSDSVTSYVYSVGVGFNATPPNGVEQTAVTNAVIAHNPATLTPEQQIAAYIRLDLDYKDVFFNASNILEVGIATLPEPVTLPAYRALLTSVLQSLASLAGTRFETHFNRERLAQGLPTTLPIGSMTLTQCAEFDELLHVWLNARKVDAINAQLTLGG